MSSFEPSGSRILYSFLVGLAGAYAGAVASLYLPDNETLRIAAPALCGATLLLIVKVLYYRAGVILLGLCLILPLYPAYYMTIADTWSKGQIVETMRAVHLRDGPSKGASSLGVLSAGTKVTLIGRNWRRIHFHVDSGQYYNYWREVRVSGVTGWVYGGYLVESD